MKIYLTSASFLFFSFVIMAVFLVPLDCMAQILSGTADGVAQTAYTDGSPNDDVFIFCGSGNNGALEVGTIAGTGPFTYSWYQYNSTNFSWTLIPGQTSSSISNLASGGYRVVVSDNSGTFLLDDIAWIWNVNVNLNAIANASACNDVNLSIAIPNLQFSYHNPPAPAAIINNNTDITVCFSGNHTYVSDLAYYLVGPPSCGSPVVTLATNNNNVCNPGNNLNNLCFTTFPSPNFNVCNQNTPLSGTFDSYSGNPINWNPLNGCNAAEGGWEVMVYDCEFDDVGSLTHASIHFQNLPVVNGSPSDIIFDSGAMNSTINDFSCNSTSASHFTVPLPAIYTTPILLNATLSGSWSTNSFAIISDPSANVTAADGAMSGDVFTYSLAVNVGTATCNFSDDVTYNNASFVPLSISYSTNLCEGGGAINPIITGGNGGTFSAVPAGLSLSNNGNIQLNTSTPGSYVVTYTKTIGGCVLTAKTGLTVQDIPENLALSPSSICEGTTFDGSANLAFQYEYFLNGISQGLPNTNSLVVSPVVNLNDDWCVRGYEGPTIIIDGQINEAYWGQPLSQANSNLTSSFGNNHLDALYVAQYRDTLNIALAGQLEAGTNNRFLLFLDTEAGGYNQLSAWTNRSNAPYYSMENLSGNIQFDAGFEPDYIMALNTDAGGIGYLDLYHMSSNTNQFIGNSNGSNLLAYQPAGSTINVTAGYEMKVALSNLSNPSGNIQLFGMLVNNPGSAGIATTLSNQFLSPADDGALSYGDDVVIFGAATPDPVHFIVGNTNCYLETCLMVNPNQSVNTPVVPDQCQNTPSPFVLNSTVGGVSGTWSPAVVNVSSLGTSIYTFTPDPLLGCYDQGTAAISVIAPVDPVFAIDNTYCQGDTPALLPTTDGTILGAWNPTAISTSAAAAAAPVSYTFTPSAGQCANSYSFNVSVNPEEVPVFSFVTSLCQNATAPALPLIDNNGIQGTWNTPITTAALGNQVHVFTPNPSDPLHECAIPLNVTVSITNGTPSTFPAIGPFCESDTPTLPLTSNEGFTGSWTPASINMTNFNAAGQNFTFQPDPNQCANSGTLNVVVQAAVNPTFTSIAALCLNATAPALPTQSLQNISGTWNPSTISTVSAGSSTYTFTPAAGACANSASLSVAVQTPTTPTFTLPLSICKNATAPTLGGASTNGINGTWSPSSANSSVVGNQNFTFTPASNVCASTFSYQLTVEDNQIPTFNAIGPYCISDTPDALTSQSIENVSGAWSPSVVSTASAGTSNYVFTPTSGLCYSSTSLSVTVLELPTITFALSHPVIDCNQPTVNVTAGGGVGYQWDSGESVDMISVSDDAPHIVTVEDVNGCMSQLSIAVPMDTATTAQLVYPFDTLNCLVSNIPIHVVGGVSYAWSPNGELTNSINVNVPDFYEVDVMFANGCTRQMSIAIGLDTISPNGIITNFSGFDTLTCLQPSITLTASGGVGYEWVNGGNTANENYMVPGIVQVEVTGANQCLDTAQYVLYQNITPPTLNLLLSDSVLNCFVDTIVVAASGNGISYSWSNGWGTNDSIAIADADTYQVTSTGSNGCSSTLSVAIEEDRFQPDSLFTYSPHMVMDDQAILELNGPSVEGIIYTWSLDGSVDMESDDITLQLPTFQAGQFEVCMEAMYTGLCQSKHCEMVEVHESLQCYVPNTFTPDQDNLNDGFKPSFSNIDLLERYEMVILNRWGEIIFQSEDPAQSWDGRYLEGEYYVPDGEYVYRIIYKEFLAVDVKELIGYVRILR